MVYDCLSGEIPKPWKDLRRAVRQEGAKPGQLTLIVARKKKEILLSKTLKLKASRTIPDY